MGIREVSRKHILNQLVRSKIEERKGRRKLNAKAFVSVHAMTQAGSAN
jgi:hypothetical protein